MVFKISSYYLNMSTSLNIGTSNNRVAFATATEPISLIVGVVPDADGDFGVSRLEREGANAIDGGGGIADDPLDG